MSTPPLPQPSIPVEPLTGADWWSARASLAARRSGRFARVWALVLGPLVLIAGLVPLLSDDPGASARSARQRLAADTVRTGAALRRAELASATAESLLIAATGAMQARSAPTRRSAAPPPVSAAPRQSSNPALASLEAAIREARRLRTPATWLVVANEPPIRDGPRMRALADSLARLTQQRDALPSGPSRDQFAAPLTAAINRLGHTIVVIADNRRAQIAAESPMVDVAPAPVQVAAPTTAAAAVSTDAPADTAALAATARTARDSLATAQQRHTAARDALATAAAAGVVPRGRFASASPALILLGLLLGGLGIRFSSALSRETSAPTIAHAVEAERTVGLPVLATVRDALLDGPARFRPSGVDPFRMLYLGLTSTGTRARTMIVTGSDPVIVAAVGARLAVSAAADHRTTLVMDLDPASIALSRLWRERAEPGLTDALAGAFTWREIARPLGSSDGLPMTMVPAGTERDDLPAGAAFEAKRDELTRFRTSFEFTILIAPASKLELAVSLVESSPIVLSAVIGETRVAEFGKEGAELKESGRRMHGTVLWDAPRPDLLSRAELAAQVSKLKNRTPGGSFAAVKKAISADPKKQ